MVANFVGKTRGERRYFGDMKVKISYRQRGRVMLEGFHTVES